MTYVPVNFLIIPYTPLCWHICTNPHIYVGVILRGFTCLKSCILLFNSIPFQVYRYECLLYLVIFILNQTLQTFHLLGLHWSVTCIQYSFDYDFFFWYVYRQHQNYDEKFLISITNTVKKLFQQQRQKPWILTCIPYTYTYLSYT